MSLIFIKIAEIVARKMVPHQGKHIMLDLEADKTLAFQMSVVEEMV